MHFKKKGKHMLEERMKKLIRGECNRITSN